MESNLFTNAPLGQSSFKATTVPTSLKQAVSQDDCRLFCAPTGTQDNKTGYLPPTTSSDPQTHQDPRFLTTKVNLKPDAKFAIEPQQETIDVILTDQEKRPCLSSLSLSPPSTPLRPSLNEVMKLQPTINIGMIGHVAHGKSTLTKRLSTVSTGKYTSEIAANLTIKLGYANVKIFKCDDKTCPKPRCFRASSGAQLDAPPCRECDGTMHLARHLSLVDSPGHHDYIMTMMSGASVMDAALMVIASDQTCPQPQTVEHLAAASMMGFCKNTIIAQNKIDLSRPNECASNYEEIRDFIRGTDAAGAPIIPISANMEVNMDVLCQYLVEKVPEPIRDLNAPCRMTLVRSFDINRPGDVLSSKYTLRGGVVGGTLTQGTLRIGQQVDIYPGIIRRDCKGESSFTPIRTKVVSLKSESHSLDFAVPGGLIAVGLTVDSFLTKGDRLVGHVLGKAGTLPPVFTQAIINYKMMKMDTSSSGEHADEKGSNKRSSPSYKRPKVGTKMLLCIGSAKVQATVSGAYSKSSKNTKKIRKHQVQVSLDRCICADVSSLVAIFDQQTGRMIGSGSISAVVALKPQETDSLIDDVQRETNQRELKAKRQWDGHLDDEQDCEDGEDENQTSDEEDSNQQDNQVRKMQMEHLLTPLSEAEFKSQHASVRFSPDEFPSVGEVTIAKITKVNADIGATVELLEYANMEGLIISSELSRQRLRSIKKVAKVGRLEVVEVMRVDKAKCFIDLSKKRISTQDRAYCLRKWGDTRTFNAVLRRLSAKTFIPLANLYAAFGYDLLEEFCQAEPYTHPVDIFHRALGDMHALDAIGLSNELKEWLLRVISIQLKQKPFKASCKVEIACLASNGVETLQKAFAVAEQATQRCLRTLISSTLSGKENGEEKRDAIDTITDYGNTDCGNVDPVSESKEKKKPSKSSSKANILSIQLEAAPSYTISYLAPTFMSTEHAKQMVQAACDSLSTSLNHSVPPAKSHFRLVQATVISRLH